MCIDFRTAGDWWVEPKPSRLSELMIEVWETLRRVSNHDEKDSLDGPDGGYLQQIKSPKVWMW